MRIPYCYSGFCHYKVGCCKDLKKRRNRVFFSANKHTSSVFFFQPTRRPFRLHFGCISIIKPPDWKKSTGDPHIAIVDHTTTTKSILGGVGKEKARLFIFLFGCVGLRFQDENSILCECFCYNISKSAPLLF